MLKHFLLIIVLLWGCRQPGPTLTAADDSKSINYSGDSLTNIAVPVGGIGTGAVLIGGRGNIRALEIFNRSAMNDQPYMTFFSLWFREGDNPPDARILEGEVQESTSGPYGIPRRQLEGIPRFEQARFSSDYPFIHLELQDDDVPLKISGEFFNPLIPLEVGKSSYPLAVFQWTVQNTGREEVSLALAFSMGNPLKNRQNNRSATHEGDRNRWFEKEDLKGIWFENQEPDDSPLFGNLLMASGHEALTVQTAWYEGAWWDDATVFWDDFSRDGKLEERKETVTWQGSNWYGSAQQSIVGCLAAHTTLAPGEKITIPFYLSWYIPNRILEAEMAFNNEEVAGTQMKNYYGIKFSSAEDALLKYRQEEDILYEMTKEYVRSVYQSSYPAEVIDAVMANTAALKTNLLMRTEEGWVHGFEGLGPDGGCCPGNCSHVWNYAQTMAALFPELEQKVREVSFLHDTFENGYQCFRTVFPLSDHWFRSVAADGQMGNIIRVYREWKNTGDSVWLAKLWPKVKPALEFAWKGSGEVKGKYHWQEHARIPWDPYKEGVMRGDQHNTYDINFFGPNMMTGSLYLAALKACSEMAGFMGEELKAEEYFDLYEKGHEKYLDLLWNGDYFVQQVEVIDGIEIPERLKSPPDEEGKVIPKYQFAGGCLTDQLLGQFLAFNAGLGFVVDSAKVRKAMSSVYEHNFIRDFSTMDNVQRVYAVNDESGVVICSWPEGDRPRIPFVYADEVWTGIEYGAAVNMIHAGLVKEGMDVVGAVRERYRGYNRNPWGEVESGMYYARSLASWGLLPALSGFRYDGSLRRMTFDPVISQEDFRTFWICGSGWGTYSQGRGEAVILLIHGDLVLSELALPFDEIVNITLDEDPVSFRLENDRIIFPGNIKMKAGSTLLISVF